MDKWLHVSNLQKAIRRGCSDQAIASAHKLWVEENAYLRYRLAVILLEDIGIANTKLLNTAFEGKLGKRWLDARGGFEWLSTNVIIPAVESTKDRSACDLGVISKNEFINFSKKYGAFETVTIDRAEKIFIDVTDICLKGLAAWRICGTDIYPHDSMPSVKGNWETWLKINQGLGVSDEIINIMTIGQKTQREWHPIYLGLLSIDSNNKKLEINKLDNSEFGDILLSACDMHTKLGKTAISNFIRNTPTLYNEIKNQNKSLTFNDVCFYIGKLLFLIEGGLLDKQLSYDKANEINKIIKAQWQTKSGLSGNKIATILFQNRNFLKDIRIDAIKNICKETPNESFEI